MMEDKNKLNTLVSILNEKIKETNLIIDKNAIEGNASDKKQAEILGYMNGLIYAKEILSANVENTAAFSENIATYAPDFNLDSEISEAIKECHNYSGVSMEFSDNIIKKLNEDSYIASIEEEMKSEDILAYIHCKNMDRYMLLHTIQEMIDSGAVKILFTEKANPKYINYLKKLCTDKL